MNQKIIELRRELHKYPEVSNDEHNTSERIINFIKEYNPDEIIRLGDTGVLFAFIGNEEGESILFRSELDALPIKEMTELKYKSVNNNVLGASSFPLLK